MFDIADRRVPVVRWFQLGAATAGIGIALAAASGTAAADDSTSAGEAGPSRGPAVSQSAGDGVDSATAENPDGSGADEDPSATGEDQASDEIAEEVVTPDDSRADTSAAGTVTDEELGEGDTAATATATRRNVDDATAADRHPVGARGEEDNTAQAPIPGEEGATASLVVSQRESRSSVAAGAAVTTPTSTGLSAPIQSSIKSLCECERPSTFVASIRVAVDQVLTETANRLAGLPDRPFTSFLEGVLYLVRRTLFPASVGVITKPVTVPLHYTTTTTSSGEPKLGIWLAAGGSTTPQLFEFDTGSAGLYAAYASAAPADSPWWGGNFTTEQEDIGVSFDSGLVYQGDSVSTAVSLFAAQNSCAALVNTGKVVVGQMDQIGSDSDPDALWGPAGSSTGEPPIDGAFYGDFGMALSYQKDGVVNAISQLTYGWGVRPGFRVHADPITNEAWMQIGLTRRDLRESDGLYFTMTPDALAPPGATVPNSGLQYYALQPFNATVNILDGDGKPVINDPGTPILPDTGAGTTLHNIQLSPAPSPKRYEDDLIDWVDEPTTGKLYPGLTLFLTGTTTDGTPVAFFEFETGNTTDGGRVAVQNPEPPPGPPTNVYYLNTGLPLFQMYDVVYSLGNSHGGGTIGLIPQGLQVSDRARTLR